MPLVTQSADNRYVKPRHYHQQSCNYAGADQLLYMIEQGWTIERIYSKQAYYGTRQVLHYLITLQLDGEVSTMRVVANPYLERLMRERYTATIKVLG